MCVCLYGVQVQGWGKFFIVYLYRYMGGQSHALSLIRILWSDLHHFAGSGSGSEFRGMPIRIRQTRIGALSIQIPHLLQKNLNIMSKMLKTRTPMTMTREIKQCKLCITNNFRSSNMCKTLGRICMEVSSLDPDRHKIYADPLNWSHDICAILHLLWSELDFLRQILYFFCEDFWSWCFMSS